MPKFKISYFDIPYGAGLFSFPEFTRREIVEAKDTFELEKYITKQKDAHGHHFRREKSFGYDYISAQGAVKVQYYTPPKIKQIK